MTVHRPIAAVAIAALTTGLAGAGALTAADASSPSVRRASGAGTIVFIKDHDVWLSTGAGTSARALTTDGTATRPYTSPSQSDAGIIAVARLDEIVRMDQSGHVLNTMNPEPLPSSVSGHPVDGNVMDVAISPDGSLIAYSLAKYLTPPGAESGYRTATGYTSAASFTPSGQRGTTFYDEPSWVGNSRTLQSGGYGSQVMVDDLGPGEPVHWFDDRDVVGDALSTDLGNSELSPNGRYLAAVRGYGADSLVAWYRVDGDATTGAPPVPPTPLCEIGPTTIDDPTWAPDSDSLAWVESDGIWVRSGVEDCAVPSQLLIPGGSEPDWSPAPLDPPEHDDPKPAGKVRNLKRPTIAGVARVGRALTARPGRWSPASVKLSFRWQRNGKPIKGADARRYKLRKPDRGARIAVTVTAAKSGWTKAAASSKPVRVRT